ncbi:MAG: hypothetical protein IJ215_00995 [Clostridia bacterium]|nr:hypothetical protein [Clostridia bacterium]
MEKLKYNYSTATLMDIQEFQSGVLNLIKNNAISFEEIRAFIMKNDGGGMSETVKQEIMRLQGIRIGAISNEMLPVKAKAARLNRFIPEKYLTGEAMEPVFADALYEEYPALRTYEEFPWYSLTEIAMLKAMGNVTETLA